jgi:hypothetical protein
MRCQVLVLLCVLAVHLGAAESASTKDPKIPVLTNLPQGRWETATADMTSVRRPNGSGGPLAEDERIDDIQFYVHPRAELLIDDIVL